MYVVPILWYITSRTTQILTQCSALASARRAATSNHKLIANIYCNIDALLQTIFLTSKPQFYLSLYFFLYNQNITYPCLIISKWHDSPLRDDNFYIPWITIYISLFQYFLSLKYQSSTYPTPSLFVLKISPLLASSSIVNLPKISAMINSPLRSSCSHLIWYVWPDPHAPIQYICSDTTQFNLIFSLLFYPLTLFFYDFIYSAHSNPIQYVRSLFPALLSPIRPSKF